MKAFQNFVNGKHVDAADGRTTAVVNPATGEQYATAPLRRRPTSTRRCRRPRAAFEGWRDATPSERSLALFRIADAVEARADELIALEVENSGKPAHLTRSEEIPPMVDQIRFFAGAARHLEGKSAGEYMTNMTSFIRREPVGVCAQVAPWNYPMMMAVWKFAPAIAAGNTVVLKPSDTTPATHRAARRDRRRVPAARRVQRHLRRPRHRPGDGRRTTPRRWSVVTGSVRAGMEVAERGVAEPQARAPRARRQGAGRGVRRRRHRRRRRGDRDRRLLQRRPGLHRGDPRDRRARRVRRLRRRARRAGEGHRRPACPTTRTCCSDRSTTPTSSRTSSGFVDRAPDHAQRRRRRAHASAATATSTSRPSSPACARTTR